MIEGDLIKRFGFSRTPLREALNQLHAEKFIEYIPNKGVRVSSLSAEEVDEIYSIRAVLEGYAANLAAKHVTLNDIRKLNSLQDRLKVDGRNNNIPGWLENNTQFHFFIPEISKNKNLYKIIEQLQRRVYRYGYLTVSIPGNIEKYIFSHEKVIGAFINKDSKSAEEFMKKHLMDVRKIIVDFLKGFPGF